MSERYELERLIEHQEKGRSFRSFFYNWVDLPEKLQKNLLISGDDVTLQNATADFSIYINGNNDTLKNVNIKGTLFIDPGASVDQIKELKTKGVI